MKYFYNNGRLFLILLTFLISTGCSLSGPQRTITSNFVPENHSSEVMGKVLLNDGSTPAQNVTVFIPNSGAEPLLFINELELSSTSRFAPPCKRPSTPYISFTCTDVNGNFTLPIVNIPSYPITIVTHKDENSVSTVIGLNELNSDIGVISLAEILISEAQEQDSEKTKIAIVFDLLDPYAEISRTLSENDLNPDLIRIDMLNSFYEIYEINETQSDVEVTTLQELVKDQNLDSLADITDYDAIFINCRSEDDIAKLNSKIRKELLNFVSNGGELFITSWSFRIEEPTIDINDYI